MNLFSEFLQAIRERRRRGRGGAGHGRCRDLSRVTAEPPRDPSHGDISTNAAMVLNKAFGKPPRVWRRAIAAKLSSASRASPRSRSPGPGFINLRLTPDRLAARPEQRAGAGRGAMAAPPSGRARRPMSNMSRPTRPGPLHVGHVRGAVFGDALAAAARVAAATTSPANTTSTMPAPRSTCWPAPPTSAICEALGETIGEIPAGLYPGDYLKPVGAGAGRGIRRRPQGHARGRVAAHRARHGHAT